MPTAPYYTKDGTRVPGTTTIIGRFKDSGALIHWAYKLGREHGVLEQRVRHEELPADTHIPRNQYDVAEKAADIGTLAHAMVEKHIDGENPEDALSDISEEDRDKARNAFVEYLEWEGQTKVKFLSQEDNLVSEEYRFGGTPDAIGQINGELCLIDWKTSNGVYPDYAIQLAAYRQLWNENNPDNPLTGPSYLCRFAKDFPDFEVRKFGDLSEAWEQFTLYRKAYEIDKQLKKRVR